MNTLKAESLAKAWMPGIREGSRRPAWEHPHDVVRLVEKVPGLSQKLTDSALQVAWLHDILEDGRKDDGTFVTSDDLVEAGFSEEVVAAVVALTNMEPGREAKALYMMSLWQSSALVRVVKLADRICNLREGSTNFKKSRWLRYVGESLYFISPLTDDLPHDAALFLKLNLLEGVGLRRLSL